MKPSSSSSSSSSYASKASVASAATILFDHMVLGFRRRRLRRLFGLRRRRLSSALLGSELCPQHSISLLELRTCPPLNLCYEYYENSPELGCELLWVIWFPLTCASLLGFRHSSPQCEDTQRFDMGIFMATHCHGCGYAGVKTGGGATCYM